MVLKKEIKKPEIDINNLGENNNENESTEQRTKKWKKLGDKLAQRLQNEEKGIKRRKIMESNGFMNGINLQYGTNNGINIGIKNEITNGGINIGITNGINNGNGMNFFKIPILKA